MNFTKQELDVILFGLMKAKHFYGDMINEIYDDPSLTAAMDHFLKKADELDNLSLKVVSLMKVGKQHE